MDAKILVSEDGVGWLKRHFKCFDEDNDVIAWSNGRTSFSVDNESDHVIWSYAKLPEESITKEEETKELSEEEDTWQI